MLLLSKEFLIVISANKYKKGEDTSFTIEKALLLSFMSFPEQHVKEITDEKILEFLVSLNPTFDMCIGQLYENGSNRVIYRQFEIRLLQFCGFYTVHSIVSTDYTGVETKQ